MELIKRYEEIFFSFIFDNNMMDYLIGVAGGISGFAIFLVIISVPFVLLYVLSKFNWHFKLINQEESKEIKEQDRQSWKLLGFLLVLSTFGVSVGYGQDTFLGFPFWVRAMVVFCGALLIYFSSHGHKK